jgi:Zn-finger nucleic acid-binding protein
MSVISCPRCQIALKKARLGLLCRKCDGCWLKFEEFDKALAADHETLVSGGLGATLTADKPKVDLSQKIACPICAEKLRRFPYLVDSGIIVDVCSHHGMWLDDGELGAIRSYCQYTGVSVEPVKKQGFFDKLFRKRR